MFHLSILQCIHARGDFCKTVFITRSNLSHRYLPSTNAYITRGETAVPKVIDDNCRIDESPVSNFSAAGRIACGFKQSQS